MSELITSGHLAISPAGAHVTSAATRHGELFYLSTTSRSGVGEPIRGGVPVIAPWFDDLLGREPAHGWARRNLWRIRSTAGGFHASLGREGTALRLYVMELTDGIHLELSALNESDRPQTVQLALHPYFALSDLTDTTVTGLEDLSLLDRLTGETACRDTALRFTDVEYARIAHGSPAVTITDAARRITITSDGADSTVVWNPGREKAASMADIGEGEWNRFLCVEPALLGEQQQGVRLAPGEDVSLGMTVSVAPLG